MMDGTFRRTERRMGLPFEVVKQMVKHFIPLGRQADPPRLRHRRLPGVADAASYITGQSISVDGGIGMR